MNGSPEVINIGLSNDDSEIKLNLQELPTANLGVGAELLMNDKKVSKQQASADIDINDLNNLEDELNNLSDSVDNGIKINKSDVFSMQSPSNGGGGVSFNIGNDNDFRDNDMRSNIGQSTANVEKDQQTWDGYGKFNEIPVNPESTMKKQPDLTKEQMLREKFKYLRKLEDLENKGVQLTKKYTMESPLAEMQGEYENIVSEKERSNSVKFQGKMLMAIITGLEFLNNKFDPFDLKLDGWAEQVNEGIDEYDEIFGELHEKYKSKAKMAPEIKLLFQLGGGAMMLHMTNTMFKSSMPGMDDIMRQNPELMQQFTQAAVNSMGETNPGFSGFMNNMMQDNIQQQPPPQRSSDPRGPPPPPVPPPPPSTGQRGRPFQNQPTEKSHFEPVERSMKNDLGGQRAEMKGPSDISDILGGLKTKTINIQQPNNEEGSTISLSELKEMNKEMNSGSVPKKSKKKKSDKNTVSLSL
mgnify:CR=1 FL=1|tara:strand:- start:98 stop:1501 length:1404 start_codon:yes stop_codon:yes gene_type:complete